MSRPYKGDNFFMRGAFDRARRAIPFMEQDKVLGWKIPYLRDWLAHPQDDLYWERSGVGDNYTEITASVYNLGGWFDSFQRGTLDNFMRMTAPDIDPEIRAKQKLLMGPWIGRGPGRLQLPLGLPRYLPVV